MANLPAAKKAIRVTKRRTASNVKKKTRLQSLVKKTIKLIELGENQLATQQFQTTQKALDKATKKKLLHPKKVGRMKSRLAKKLNSLDSNVKTAPKNS